MNKSKRDGNGLNKRERAILKFIEKEIEAKGFAPSVREIGRAVGLSSTATVQGYLKALEERGFLKKETQKGRTLRLLKNYKGDNVIADQQGISETKQYYSNKEMINVPLVGKITAGQPILAVENITDTFPIPTAVTAGWMPLKVSQHQHGIIIFYVPAQAVLLQHPAVQNRPDHIRPLSIHQIHREVFRPAVLIHQF